MSKPSTGVGGYPLRLASLVSKPSCRSVSKQPQRCCRPAAGLGYTLPEAANGVEAPAVRQKFAGEDIHLLLTEVVMPEMGRGELAQRFATTLPRTKLIFMCFFLPPSPRNRFTS